MNRSGVVPGPLCVCLDGVEEVLMFEQLVSDATTRIVIVGATALLVVVVVAIAMDVFIGHAERDEPAGRS